MPLTVTVLQSNYLPWKGYFDLIRRSDLFVFYDDVQFTKNDWRNRNQIKTRNGLLWLSIPCGTDLNRRICDVALADHAWQEKHWRSIRQEYLKAPHFEWCRRFLEPVYLDARWTNLSELNQHLVTLVAREMGIPTPFDDSRRHGLQGSRGERLLQLLKAVGATRYLSGPAARSYLDEAAFREAGVEVEWMSYGPYPEYPQFHPPFVHAVSVVDLLLQTGPEAARYLEPVR